MAINIQQQQQSNTQTTSFSLSQIHGTGDNNGRFLEDVTGVLVDIKVREGFYNFTNPKTGEIITRPNSWIAVFDDGSLFSWPTYQDPTTGQVLPWSRFDPSIDLAACAQQGIAIHLWKDERKFTHLELAAQQSQNMSVMSIANRQPTVNQGMPF